MVKPDYPKTILEFAARFHSDEVCHEYLIQSRWPDGFVCPKCQHRGGWWLSKYQRFECAACHRQTSPLAGTLMHRSHFSVRIWFWAAYLVTTHTPGMSALQLKRQLGIGQIRNAWFLLHRLRKAMVKQERELLRGLIEADEAYLGGPAKGFRGRGVIKAPNKTLVAGAVEIISYKNRNGEIEEKSGRIRLQVMRAASAANVQKFLQQNVTPGSTIRSDGWRGYSLDALKGFGHDRNVQGKPARAAELSPHIHQAFGNLQSWLIGIHHGVDSKYMQSYLDEFVFRFNRRECPMVSFRSVLEILFGKPPVKLSKFTKP